MSEWFLVLAFILAALAATYLLAEWMSRRYSRARARIAPLAPGERTRNVGDPFDQDEGAGG